MHGLNILRHELVSFFNVSKTLQKLDFVLINESEQSKHIRFSKTAYSLLISKLVNDTDCFLFYSCLSS